MKSTADVIICGAGIAGVATAYALVTREQVTDIVLVDANPPLSLTTACSGENYRDWWPQPEMVALCRRSIALMEEMSARTENAIRMQSTGYLYVTRGDAAMLHDTLRARYAAAGEIRVHTQASDSYQPNAAYVRNGELRPTPALHGADLLLDRALIQAHFPHLAPDVTAALHVRRAGAVSVQQLGMQMLETVRQAGGRLVRGIMTGVRQTRDDGFAVEIEINSSTLNMTTRKLVLASGPFLGEHAAMLGETLPLHTVMQQKIAMRDPQQILPRNAPFTIFLDPQHLPWEPAPRAELKSTPETAWMTDALPGGLHIKPEGSGTSDWIKLGWAMNRQSESPSMTPAGTPEFPEMVLRGAGALIPDLAGYADRIPRGLVHYAGYYTKTPENLPLIGPLETPGCTIIGALSGFGTMAACAAGDLAAAWVVGAARPTYADAFIPGRYADPAAARRLALSADTGEL